jgi:hypothetical protein
MKRLLVLAVVAVFVAVVPASSAVATPPDRFPTGNTPVSFAAGDVCPFALSVEPVVDREVTTLHYDSQGNLRWISITGFLSARFTNTDAGKSMVINISGPGKITFLEDGTAVLDASGRWAFYNRSIDNPPSQLILNTGHVVLHQSPIPPNPVTIVQRTGRARNLCPALA